MKLIMLLVSIITIPAISLVAGFMWNLFVPGSGWFVGGFTFIVLVAMSSVRK